MTRTPMLAAFLIAAIPQPAAAMTGAQLLSAGESFAIGYVWGATEILTQLKPNEASGKLTDHQQKCLADAGIKSGVMFDGVKSLLNRKPEMLAAPAFVAVATFIYDMCGPPE